MYFEIAAIAAVILFAFLTFYVIRTLISLRRTLQRVDTLTVEIDYKLRQLESTAKAISNIGDICEEKTSVLREQFLEKKERQKKADIDCSEDIAEWLLASLKLGAKFIRRK